MDPLCQTSAGHPVLKETATLLKEYAKELDERLKAILRKQWKKEPLNLHKRGKIVVGKWVG